MADPRHVLGRSGEDAAEERLRTNGYRILDRRFRCSAGEIDIIALDGDTLVFVEVKTRRRGNRHIAPSDAVDWRKRARMVRAARFFLGRHPACDRPCRFDVIELIGDGSGTWRTYRHLVDAFRP
jgi:putative endonuclease